jgi:glycosyltransferase involved in cell wall biosynthesis
MARIALLLPNLAAGGAERVTLTLAAEFLAAGDAVDLVVVRAEGALMAAIPAGVRLINLNANRLRHCVRPLAEYLEAARPDALLAQMWPLSSLAVWAARHSATRVVVVEHIDLSAYSKTWGPLARALLSPVIRWSHPRAAARVGVSRGVANDLARLCRLDRRQVEAIHNPIPLPAKADQSRASVWGPALGRRVLTVGTLKPQKNQRLLIEAFARICTADDRLAIVGEGDERRTLEKSAEAFGISQQVLLPGFTATPDDWYAAADLFVLSSDYEGFGNVVAEALGHGLTVVSTDCLSGPAEILQGVGRLVPVGDVEALADTMQLALTRPDDPSSARSRAEAFAPAAIAAKYRILLLGHPL